LERILLKIHTVYIVQQIIINWLNNITYKKYIKGTE